MVKERPFEVRTKSSKPCIQLYWYLTILLTLNCCASKHKFRKVPENSKNDLGSQAAVEQH
jgi:hypothetical protein